MSTTLAEPEALDQRQLLAALRAVRRGDFSARLPMDLSGLRRSSSGSPELSVATAALASAPHWVW
ncbi:MAG: hypothetical protein ACKVVP_06335 [Chloroflexota bacterium]